MKTLQINRGLLVGFLSFAAMLVSLHPAYAADVVLYDNLTGYNATYPVFNQVYWFFYNTENIIEQKLASRFSTGTFSGTLSSVTLPLHNYINGETSVSLYGDDGGKPGGFLAKLEGTLGNIGSGNDENNQPIFGRATYSGSGISLASNTTYWVVLAEQGLPLSFCVGQVECGGEYWWAEKNDSTSPRSLYYSIDGQRVRDWMPTGSSYVQLMQVIGSTTQQPLANAGANGTAHEGSMVTLDGSGSSDPSGLALTYSWEFASAPSGSSATLSDPTAVSPSFTVDQLGDYIVQLVVTNSDGAASQPATVTISTYNTAPVADPGPAQAIVQIGTTVHLDGSQSYDADGDPITYSWTFTSKPVSSAANLNGDTTAAPTFVADAQGTYVIQLVVSDPWVPSTAKTVTVSFNNVKPAANAGTGQLATLGDLVTVDGSGSSDANSDPLTYQWSFAAVPAGSLATLANPTAIQTTFIPDQPGTYGLQLIVNDGVVDSDPSTVQVQVTAVADGDTFTLLSNAISLIACLDPSVFRNSNMQNSLINKLQAVTSAIQSGDYDAAVDKLQNDLMGKADGCAVSGAPDKNDWILMCESQRAVYKSLMTIVERLR